MSGAVVGSEEMPVPSNFPQSKEASEFACTASNFSDGQAKDQGSWPAGPAPDGKGTFTVSPVTPG